MKGFSIIVAMDAARGIGKDNRIPWRLSRDMQHFKEITTAVYSPGLSNVVIMGRNTWESLPERFRPLPGRVNAVLTTKADYLLPAGVMRFGSFEEAINLFCDQKKSFGEVFVIGGAAVYAEAIKHKRCFKIYQTSIDAYFECDAFFLETPDLFKESSCSGPFQDNDLRFSFFVLESHHIENE